jgi:hypothetical protein
MEHMTNNIKQQLTQYLDLQEKSGREGKLETVLCREALAEIQRLETNYASLSNAIDERSPLMRLAETLERIERRMQNRWNLL